MPEQVESGFKWWIRYVIVPLIGGGGIVAIVIALIGKPASTPSDGSITVKHVEFRAYSMEHQVNGSKELLAPGGTRPVHTGELIEFEWGISPHTEQLYFVVRPRSGAKSAQPVGDKGQTLLRPTENATYSLETNHGSVAEFALNVQ